VSVPGFSRPGYDAIRIIHYARSVSISLVKSGNAPKRKYNFQDKHVPECNSGTRRKRRAAGFRGLRRPVPRTSALACPCASSGYVTILGRVLETDTSSRRRRHFACVSSRFFVIGFNFSRMFAGRVDYESLRWLCPAAPDETPWTICARSSSDILRYALNVSSFSMRQVWRFASLG